MMAELQLTDVQRGLLSVLCEAPEKWHSRKDIESVIPGGMS